MEQKHASVPGWRLVDLAELAGAAARMDGNADLFQTAAWFQNLVNHGLAMPMQPFLPALLDAQGRVTCVLPLAATSQGLRSLSNYYSSLFGPVGAVPPVEWEALAGLLRRQPHGGVLDLHPLDADARWVDELATALRDVGYWVDRYFCFGNWYLPVTHARFDDYFGTLPPALRHSIERGRRRLTRAGSHVLKVHTEPGAALDAAITSFTSVYGRSWKRPEPSAQFMPQLARMAAARGWLRLGVLELHGEPIAAQVWLVAGGKANIYKLAYVQGFERFSPGSVLTAALMAHVMDVDGVREVDYLTGDDAYKRDWMSHRRERVGMVAFDPLRLGGLLASARHYGGKAWRRLGR
ncbi:MAG: GNAT family N-acetyltransferase [Pseudorhodoferax sp.]